MLETFETRSSLDNALFEGGSPLEIQIHANPPDIKAWKPSFLFLRQRVETFAYKLKPKGTGEFASFIDTEGKPVHFSISSTEKELSNKEIVSSLRKVFDDTAFVEIGHRLQHSEPRRYRVVPAGDKVQLVAVLS